jgi:hypothetical protein
MKNLLKKLIFFMAIAFSASPSLINATGKTTTNDNIKDNKGMEQSTVISAKPRISKFRNFLKAERRRANLFDATFDQDFTLISNN